MNSALSGTSGAYICLMNVDITCVGDGVRPNATDVVSPRGGWRCQMPRFHIMKLVKRTKRKNPEGLRPDGQKAERGWEAKFEAVLKEYGATRANGGVASTATQSRNAKVVFGGLHA